MLSEAHGEFQVGVDAGLVNGPGDHIFLVENVQNFGTDRILLLVTEIQSQSGVGRGPGMVARARAATPFILGGGGEAGYTSPVTSSSLLMSWRIRRPARPVHVGVPVFQVWKLP